MVVDWEVVFVLYCFSIYVSVAYRHIKSDSRGNATQRIDPRYPNEAGWHAAMWILIISATWPIVLIWIGLKQSYTMSSNFWNWLTNSP